MIPQVLFVKKKHAKDVKIALEKASILNKDYRMTPANHDYLSLFSAPIVYIEDDDSKCSSSPLDSQLLPLCKIIDEEEAVGIGNTSSPSTLASNYIAIPVLHHSDDVLKNRVWMDKVAGRGMQECPLSTSLLGNTKRGMKKKASSVLSLAREMQQQSFSSGENKKWNIIEAVLINTISQFSSAQCCDETTNKQEIENFVASLSKGTCPKKLELIGDDRTLVIPKGALSLKEESFQSLLRRFVSIVNDRDIEKGGEIELEGNVSSFLTMLWSNLAEMYMSPRVVRRGDIDPNSKVRESGHVLLWIDNKLSTSECFASDGPGSRGWITVTEQGIKQSFDLTKVMFSRGNITEKIRFGRIVQKGEIILDMYAGIGYYSLPALVHGKAKFVYACEWNPHAVFALRYNLKQNSVDNQATVLEGDSRIILQENNDLQEVGVDRVILGLLPTSEGGWKTAVSALNKQTGGWLHIHGNVPTSERDQWLVWICVKMDEILSGILVGSDQASYVILCHHIERVKSFAPKIDHFVADIFIGPKLPQNLNIDMEGRRKGILHQSGKILDCPDNVTPPSCAFGGILHKKWMMTT